MQNINEIETTSLNKKTVENRRVLLLNPFLDRCVEPKNENEKASIDPRGHFFLDTPLGLVFIYSYAKELLKNIDLSVIDGHAQLVENAEDGMEKNWETLLARIEKLNPAVIGIGCSFYRASPLFHETCKRIKDILPNVTIIAGGNYPTDFYEQALDDKNVNYIVMSEGEGPFVSFLNAYFKDGDMTTIPGLRFKNTDGTINAFSDKSREHFVNLETLPQLDRSPFLMEKYGHGRSVLDRIFGSKENYRALEMCISRGCPYECSFCNAMNFWDRRLRYRDTESVLDEMEILRDEYGANVILINDDNYLLNKKRVTEICNGMLKRNLNLKWVANGGSNVRVLLDEEYLDLVIESGYCLFNLAIESGSQETLDRIKKPLNIDETWKLVEILRKKYPSMWLNGHYILGFPFETKQDIIDTVNFSMELGLDWNTYSIFKPFPNTELYDYCIAEGYMEEFDPSCVDNISTIDGVDWKREWATEYGYEANLLANFVKNENLMHREAHIDQALRDLEYVINITNGTHALAYRYAAIAAERLGNAEKRKKYSQEERRVLNTSTEFHKWYKKFGIPIPV